MYFTKVEENEQEMIDDSFHSSSISEPESGSCFQQSSITSENLCNLSSELDEEDKILCKNQADIFGLKIDQKLNGFKNQLHSLKNSNYEMLVNLEKAGAQMFNMHKEMGQKKDIMEALVSLGRQMDEYKAQFAELSKDLNLLRKEKSTSVSTDGKNPNEKYRGHCEEKNVISDCKYFHLHYSYS